MGKIEKAKRIIFLFFVTLNIILFILYINSLSTINELKKPKFELVSPAVSYKELDEFLDEQNKLIVSYRDMKPLILNIVNDTSGRYNIYFEDLTTGAWLGINEKDTFMPLSLVKLPLMVAVLKKIEKKELTLEQNLTLLTEDLDSEFGTLYLKGEGYQVSVKRLLQYLIQDSDNTAFHVLLRETSLQEFENARIAMGLPPIDEPNLITAKDYSNMLRSLYFSSYLRRTYSEIALSLMANTNFDSGIPKGIPLNIKVAHKVGLSPSLGYFHDCGIIYEEYPYLLCIMSSNSTQEESDRVISKISKTVYDYRHS